MLIGARTAAWSGGGDVPFHGYVSNGLVAYWDAIDNVALGDSAHDNSATNWIDLVSGKIINNCVFGDAYSRKSAQSSTCTGFFIRGDISFQSLLTFTGFNWSVWCGFGIGTEAGLQRGITIRGANNGGTVEGAAKYSAQPAEKVSSGNLGLVIGVPSTVCVVFHYSTKVFDVYVNGVFHSSNDMSSIYNLDGINLNLGSSSYHIDQYNVDRKNILLYDRALTQSDVLKNYKNDKARFGIA